MRDMGCSGTYYGSSPPDWTPEGWAKIEVGDFSKKSKLGICKPRQWRPSKFGFVFSKTTASMSIKIPGRQYVAANVAAMNGFYWVLVSKWDGSPVAKPSGPTGGTVPNIRAGAPYPDELHELWRAPVRLGENEVDGRNFKTTHPVWDPCYWW